jgi:hypothetical protein
MADKIKGIVSKTLILFLLVIPISGFGEVMIGEMEGGQGNKCPLSESDLKAATAYLKFKSVKSSFIPTGIPAVYGEELDISFDKVQDAINKVRVYGPTHSKSDKKIVLTGENLKRYTNIGQQIACEYCCKAKTLVRKDGVAACGCAHSIMMRGLSAYLIENHPEFTDEQILDELKTWKITYFPKKTLEVKLAEMEKSGDEDIKGIMKEFPEFLPKMVGGC